ncbi:hypothetical protein Q3G72_029013 [Acer saccharum]|nr:hypothetical protein Q3G72_029013 [Acer saccharum]
MKGKRWAAMRGIDECEMISNLPEGLRRDIKYHLCLDLVRQVVAKRLKSTLQNCNVRYLKKDNGHTLLLGEEYKCIWPDQQEFVRMAARFGATIVPFGAVGEDDIADLVLDYEDLMKIPVLNDFIKENNHDINLRDEISGEVANQRYLFQDFCRRSLAVFIICLGSQFEQRENKTL